jgi:hypothetical protein
MGVLPSRNHFVDVAVGRCLGGGGLAHPVAPSKTSYLPRYLYFEVKVPALSLQRTEGQGRGTRWFRSPIGRSRSTRTGCPVLVSALLRRQGGGFDFLPAFLFSERPANYFVAVDVGCTNPAYD